MALWELDRDFDEYFKTFTENDLNHIIQTVETNINLAKEHIEIHKGQISELNEALSYAKNQLEDSKADIVVMEKMKDAALIKLDNLEVQ
jgi:hypothetical protein